MAIRRSREVRRSHCSVEYVVLRTSDTYCTCTILRSTLLLYGVFTNCHIRKISYVSYVRKGSLPKSSENFCQIFCNDPTIVRSSELSCGYKWLHPLAASALTIHHDREIYRGRSVQVALCKFGVCAEHTAHHHLFRVLSTGPLACFYGWRQAAGI
jgi:hypothetical protein